jgi:hypothetical protein
VRPPTLAIDAGIAALLAALVLIVSPGLAIAAIIAISVVLVCSISFAVDALSRRGWPPRRRRRVR